MNPDWIGKLWLKVYALREQLPWGLGRDMGEFVDMMISPTLCCYEVGDFQGVVMFTNIKEAEGLVDDEPSACCHLLVWDTIYLYRNTKMFRELLCDFFKRYDVHRVYGEIPASMRLNRFLGKGIGFNVVGVFRKKIPRGEGVWEDSTLVDILREDLEVDYGLLGSDSGRGVSGGISSVQQ